MFIGKVTGHVVANQKESAMAEAKLVVIEAHSGSEPGAADLGPTGRFVAAVDSLGAGVGEYMLVAQGSSARMTDQTRSMPVDAVVIGIVDSIRLADRILSRTDGTLT